MVSISLAQVVMPSLSSVFELGLGLVGVFIFVMFLVKAYQDRNDRPASPYLGMPFLVISMIVMALGIAGNAIDLTAYTSVFAQVFGLILKVAFTTTMFPFWFAGLVIIPVAHIFPFLKGTFDRFGK